MTKLRGEIKTKKDSDYHGAIIMIAGIERARELGGFIVQSPDPARVDELILDEEVENLYVYGR